MMRILVFATILLNMACSSKKNVSASSPENDPVISTQVQDDEISEDEAPFMTFERTLCFGECPAYRITVFSDGRAQYEGRKFTERIGNYTARMDKAQMNEILEEAERVGFFGMKDEYDNRAVTDVPSCMIMIRGNEGGKYIHDRFDAPDVLRNFEKYVDNILLNLDWQKAD